MNTNMLTDRVCLIELPPELVDSDEKAYLDACAPRSASKTHYLILDFSGVRTMNGLGATMLVKLAALSHRRGQQLAAIGLGDHYRDVFRLTGLEGAFTIYDSREKAFSAAGLSGSSLPDRTGPQSKPVDSSYWASPVDRLIMPPMPRAAINQNMSGRRVVGPVEGFGPLWQKTYRLKLNKPGLTPEAVIDTLKKNFPRFQPAYNRFYPTANGIQPGEVVAIDSSTPGGPVSTGVMVMYADPRSFTFITPQGHPESGWVSFSAFEKQDGVIVQILGLARSNDPVYEAAFRTVGSKMQINIWRHVLTSLAAYYGLPPDITVEPRVVDSQMRWSQAGNVWYNAQIRTIIQTPARLLRTTPVNPDRKLK